MSTKTAMTEAEKRAVWDVLVQQCGASGRGRDDFLYHFPQCREFRFNGDLGFGGKVWFDPGAGARHRLFVSCYPEDETPQRREQIKQANAALATITPEEQP